MIEFDLGPRGFPGELNFVHKRIGRGLLGLVTGGPAAAIGGFLSGGGPAAPPPQQQRFAPGGVLPPGSPCKFPAVRVAGTCVNPLALPPGGQPFTRPIGNGFGQAVMGQYGAALVPEASTTTTLRCPRGAVLGTDDLCYNKRDLRKSERKWVPGRKPLLTGGERNAIRIAARAGTKLARAKKDLRKAGRLLEKAC